MSAKQLWNSANHEQRQQYAKQAGIVGNPSSQWAYLDSWQRRQLCFALEGCDVHEDDRNSEDITATYAPEDDKLRIYVNTSDGRVARETFNYLRECGYKSTPKQNCQFVASWSIRAENAALALIAEGDDIGDEDYSPQERAADRAERFSIYRDKRRSEATGLADRYDAGPQAYGHQNQAKAERAAAKRDRVRDNSLTQWDKAEYWQRRTEGVIAHALHRSSPSVRRGRILTIEKEIRRVENDYTPDKNSKPMMPDDPYNHTDSVLYFIRCGSRGGSWVTAKQIKARKEGSQRYLNHLRMRLAYETQMIGDDGGQCSEQDIVPGGWIRVSRSSMVQPVTKDGWSQVLSVKKSPATGRVTSVEVLGTDVYGWADNKNEIAPRRVKVERLGEDAYRPPTPEELEDFSTQQKAAKKKAKASKPKAPPLINPKPEDAKRLQAILNSLESQEADHSDTINSTQAAYSSQSKGSYSKCETIGIGEKGLPFREYEHSTSGSSQREVVFKVRIYRNGLKASRVVIITDKPQKSIPWDAIEEARKRHPTEAAHAQMFADLVSRRSEWGYQFDGLPEDEREAARKLRQDAAYLGWVRIPCVNDFYITDEGQKILDKYTVKEMV